MNIFDKRILFMEQDLQSKLATLNEAQRGPTLHKDGPLIVIAGAGSGKTRVLTYRIAYLMSQEIDSFSILALTFTNKAAREMKERIGQLVGESEAKNLWMGTFHSIFARILRIEADKLGYPTNFTIYDAQDSERLVSSIIKQFGLDKDIYKSKQIKNRISSLKNSLVTVRAYYNNHDLQESDVMSRRPKFGEIYKEYVERCFKAGAMDFDDLLLKTNELLNRHPDVLAKYQDRFRYILVDEYQDTNHSQYLIVRALSDKFQNICVVGDDAQSIYAFRGANINNILNFQKDYDSVKMYRLEQNYRSTQNIVNAANSIISHNKTKLDKNVWTQNSEGNKIEVKGCPTDADEGRYVAGSIFELAMQNSAKYSEFSILYRTNAQSRSLEDALRKRNIPYRVFGGMSFYQRKEIKDILAYLRVIVNPKDEESLKRIINYPVRGIGDTTITKLTIAANERNLSLLEVMEQISMQDLGLNKGIRQKLTSFVELIKSFQILEAESNAFEIVDEVTKKTKIITELKKDNTPEGISRIENIEELLNGIKDFTEGQKEVDESTGSLSEFLEDVALATDLDKEEDKEDTNRVSLMTIHLAKGLEFPYVYIVGLEENLFPSAMNLASRDELEEERRLFYVALTRAEKQASLSYAQSRYRWGKLNTADPSRFIQEIDNQYIDIKTPNESYEYKSLTDNDIFDAPPKKFKVKPTPSNEQLNTKPNPSQLKKLRALNDDTELLPAKTPLINLSIGAKIEHQRFGRGVVTELEGKGNDKKAIIKFSGVGEKKLLLRFTKLKILE